MQEIHPKNHEFVFNNQKKNIKTIFEKWLREGIIIKEIIFFEFDKLYPYLNKNFKDINFLIKPHPAENLDYYAKLEKKKFKKYKILKTNENIVHIYSICSSMYILQLYHINRNFFTCKNCINFIPWRNKKSEFPCQGCYL